MTVKKSERTEPLRQYLFGLRTKDERIKKAWDLKQSGETIKSLMSEDFIEYCHELGLSNRNIAYVLNCSAGTVGQYVSQYHSMAFDDLMFEEVNYTEDIMNMQTLVDEVPIGQRFVENAFILLSDFQAGALVTAEGYDSSPAKTIENYFDLLIERFLEAVQFRNLHVGTLNVMLLGDLVEGWNKFPNQQTIPIRKQKEVVVKQVLRFIKHATLVTPNIHVYGVYGNHGEVTRYHASTDNWDLMAMEEIEMHLEYMKKLDPMFEGVKSFISSEEVQIHEIGGFKYLLTHGHQLKGFSVESWKSSMNKWHVSMDGFDAMIMGHWHTFNWVSNNGVQLVVNGCMYKSEFVKYKLKGKEDICQVFFGSSELDPVAWMDKLDVDQGINIRRN